MATKNITLTNLEIYTTAQALMENITTDMNLPVKVGFYIQKNMKKMDIPCYEFSNVKETNRLYLWTFPFT